jgi:hypothetical protein
MRRLLAESVGASQSLAAGARPYWSRGLKWPQSGDLSTSGDHHERIIALQSSAGLMRIGCSNWGAATTAATMWDVYHGRFVSLAVVATGLLGSLALQVRGF